jgi:hypothetical protein
MAGLKIVKPLRGLSRGPGLMSPVIEEVINGNQK